MKSSSRNLLLGLACAAVSGASVQAQNWKDPLADPNANFYTIQSNFYAEWGVREQQNNQSRQDNTLLNDKWPGNDPASPVAAPFMKGGYKQFKRWEYYMEPRVYPSGDITLPSSNYERFVQYVDATPAAMDQYVMTYGSAPIGSQAQQNRSQGPNTNPNIMSSTWQFAGPTGYPTNGGAGRINVIRFDPQNSNTMYAGAPAGGLWKSTNAGTTWSIVSSTDQIASIGVTDIAVDPTNSNTIYIATGDGDAGDTYSVGVLKSTDGGVTWATTGLNWTTSQGRTISRLLINPTNNQILIAFTSNGIYRTANAGTSWTQVQNTNAFRDGEFKPGDPNTVYASGTNFWKSTNGGTSWTQITSGVPASANVDRLSIAVTPANAAYVYILAGSAANNGYQGLYRSTDSGTTFTTRSTTPNIMGWSNTGADTGGQSWYDHGLDVSQTNADVVVVGGVNHWRSTNGGTNWTLNAHWTGSGAPYVHADVHCVIFFPGSGTRYFSGNDGGINETTNSGGAWSDRSAQLCIAQPYRIGLSASNAAMWITGHQDNGTNLKNGASYAEVMGGDGMDCFIDRTNNNVMYGEQYNGSLNRSTNGGASWTGITSGLTGNAPWVTAWYQDPTTANTLYCGRTNLFRSTNQGTNWAAVTSAVPGTGTIVDFKIAPSNNQVIYVVKSNAVYKTTNAGGAWTTVTGTLPVGSAAITRVDVHPNDPNHVLVTFSGYSAGNKVFETTNGGTSWTNISTGLPNIPVNCVRFMPGTSTTTDAVYVGCDIGVYYKDNTFANWQPYFTGLPNVPIFDLEIYTGTGTLRAATYGRGVWEVDIYNPGTLAPIADFTANQTVVCPGNGVNFTDMSSFTPTSWSWSFQGGTPATSTAQNPSGITWSAPGTYSVTLTATNGNGSDTETKTSYITILANAAAPPLVEGFENATFVPANWTAMNANNDGIFWDRNNVGAASSWSARFDNYNNDAAGSRDEMWAPRQTFASLSACTLTFDVAYARYNATYSDTMSVWISTNCGSTWTQIWNKGGTTLATAPDQTATAFVPNSTQWRNESVPLTAYLGQSSVLIKFVNHGRYGQCLYLDNVNITGTSTPALPSATFTASATTVCAGTPVSFTSTSTNAPTTWSWTFPSGTPATATTQNVASVVWNTAGTYTVTHTATNGSGTGTTTQVITVNANPTVAATASNTTLCNGSSTTLTATGASTYAWMPGSLSGSPVTVTPTSTTTYTVTGTAANGCTGTGTRTITVNPLPTVATTATSTTLCSGSSTTITASGASTYTWMPGSLTGTSVTVSPTTTTTYTVTGTDANGCSATSTRLITVNASPTVTATASSTTICSGNSTTLTATGASTYAWMPGSLTGSPVTVSPTTTITYTVTGTAANGCTSTATRLITVNPTPTVTATASNTTICSGNSTTITASGATTYTWMPGSLTGTSVTVSPTTTTTYTVTGTSAGCSSTATRLITVNPTPTVTTTASNTTICSGSSTTLTGNGASTYTWNPGSLSGSPVTVSPATTTTYTVTGTGANGCTATATRLITVNASPTVAVTAGNTSICTGGSTSITASGASTYNWMPGSMAGATVTVSPAATTTYTVTGTAANGCTNVQTITISVGAAPTVTATSSAPSICVGGSSTLTASGTTSYTWMPGSLTGSSVVVSPTATTTYTVTGSNGPGCTNTTTITVTVNSNPTVTATASSNTICAGSTTTLTGTGASTYVWNPGNISGSPITVSPTANTTYTVTGTNAAGCTATATRAITVNPAPTLTMTPTSASICVGGSVTISGSTTANHTYSWSPSAGLSNPNAASTVASPTITTTYVLTKTRTSTGCSTTGSVVVTVNPSPTVTTTASSTSICTGGTTSLTASGANTYTWMPGSLTGTTVTVSPTSTTTYTVTGTGPGGCTSTQTVNVTVGAPPTVTATSSGAICNGDSTTLTGNGASSYTWMPGSLTGSSVSVSPSANTTYTVTGTAANGCTNTSTVSVNVNALPSVNASASSNTLCIGNSVTLNAGGASTYTWMPGSLSGSSVTDSPVATTTYTVTGTDANGCSNTSTVGVTVNALPTVSATASSSSVCAGSGVTLTGNGASTYTWMPGSLTGTSVTDVPASATTYTVTGTDANGCSNTSTVSVGVNTLPTVAVTLPMDTFCNIDGPTALSGGTPAGGTYSGPGVSGNSFDPSSVGAGTYNITYTYVDGNGCSDSASQAVVVDVCSGLNNNNGTVNVSVIPNPNNGEFVLTFNVSSADDYVLEIHNAIGQVVYIEMLNNFSGQYRNDISLAEFGRGVYTVRLRGSDNETVIRVITF
jgi:PKD repeat protein